MPTPKIDELRDYVVVSSGSDVQTAINTTLIDKVNELVEQVNRNTQAIGTLAAWLVQAQTGFGENDFMGIISILDGTYSE